MNVPIEYIKEFVANPADVFTRLWNELAWVQRDQTPRLEYYSNDFNVPYTYGRGAGVRTYEAQPYHPLVSEIRSKLEGKTGTKFEVCFLNGYRDGSDQLGWHADDCLRWTMLVPSLLCHSEHAGKFTSGRRTPANSANWLSKNLTAFMLMRQPVTPEPVNATAAMTKK